MHAFVPVNLSLRTSGRLTSEEIIDRMMTDPDIVVDHDELLS